MRLWDLNLDEYTKLKPPMDEKERERGRVGTEKEGQMVSRNGGEKERVQKMWICILSVLWLGVQAKPL